MLQAEIRTRIENAANDIFKRPEFLGRVYALGDIITFNSLRREDLFKILEIKERKINSWLSEQGCSFKMQDELREFVIEEGFDVKIPDVSVAVAKIDSVCLIEVRSRGELSKLNFSRGNIYSENENAYRCSFSQGTLLYTCRESGQDG